MGAQVYPPLTLLSCAYRSPDFSRHLETRHCRSVRRLRSWPRSRRIKTKRQPGDSILANDVKKSGHFRIPVEWPVTIVADQIQIKGETRIVTDTGFFLHCEERLSGNGSYQMILTPPNHNPVQTKGQLIWSNFDIAVRRGFVSGMGFYFAKIADRDRRVLQEAISDALKPKPAD